MGAGNVFLSSNAMPEELHTENDYGHTVINVPQQKLIRGSIDSPIPMFIFKLNDKQQLALPIVDELSFLYSGRFLSHRQDYKYGMNHNDEPFINISSYTNEKLFNHLRTSFTHLLND